MNTNITSGGGMTAGSSATFITTAGLPHEKKFGFWRDTICEAFLPLDCKPTSNRPFFGEIATTQVKEVGFSYIHSQGFKTSSTSAKCRNGKESIFIDLQLRGMSTILQGNREAKLGPGDLTCFETAHPYSTTSSDDCETLTLFMPREIFVRKIGSIEQLTARAIRGNTCMGALLSGFLRQVASGIGKVDAVTASRLTEQSLDLVSTAFGNLISQQGLCQGSSARISLMYRARNLIEEHLRDPTLNPEKIARALGISMRYLQDLFHEENTTVRNWIWQRRLEKCRQDLSDRLLASQSVSYIAFNSGFSNLSHFSTRFKAAFSMTPSEFRHAQLDAKQSKTGCNRH